MTELFTLKHNPLVDPAMHIWSWQIPVYLFLGGLVAGLMILSGYHIIRDRYDTDRPHGHYVTAPVLSVVLLSLGMLALFFDLEHKIDVWRLYMTFEVTSPMSWGSWILLLVYPVLVASALLNFREAQPKLAARYPAVAEVAAAMRSRSGVVNLIGFANIALGAGLGIYTGILLSSLAARPLWSSALLGPLFLFSGLSTGAATLHMLTHIEKGEDNSYGDFLVASMVGWIRPKHGEHEGAVKLAHADNGFLTIELSILMLFLINLSGSSAAGHDAAALLLTGPYAAVFWVFVVGSGLVIPLILQGLQAANRIRPPMIPALLVLVGGLVLRFVLVYAGQASHWPRIAGF